MKARYFNTTGMSGADLAEVLEQVSRQDRIVLQYFARVERTSPSRCHQALISNNEIDSSTPLTSIRRSITTLTARNFLKKTDEKTKGKYGRTEFVWKSRPFSPLQVRQLQLFA